MPEQPPGKPEDNEGADVQHCHRDQDALPQGHLADEPLNDAPIVPHPAPERPVFVENAALGLALKAAAVIAAATAGVYGAYQIIVYASPHRTDAADLTRLAVLVGLLGAAATIDQVRNLIARYLSAVASVSVMSGIVIAIWPVYSHAHLSWLVLITVVALSAFVVGGLAAIIWGYFSEQTPADPQDRPRVSSFLLAIGILAIIAAALLQIRALTLAPP